MARSILKKKEEPKKIKVVHETQKVTKKPKVICQSCKKPLAVDNYYKDGSSKTGYQIICKKCMYKRTIDNDTGQVTKSGMLSLLQYLDKPYIHSLWLNVRDNNYKPEAKVGAYLRIINTDKYKGLKFKDSDNEWNIPDEKDSTMEKSVYDAIWKGNYTKREIQTLNNLYDEYTRDFVISDASQKDYTRKICKASLELDECTDGLRNGTVSEQRYKLAKDTFDSLSKSAKFAKSERTEDDSIGCFGKIFDLVEKNIWVDNYVPEEEDVYDKLISQLSNIERSFN